ncbi:ferredoxin [Pseudosulfitobacter pseudonitzschiae]|uniref:Ferredoxin n=1 Tax=Pseudosulfitobacter pseudonitzschiae TaxID=1402135 RepID=A0A221K2Y6_9RHOB|nr:ferredoxin [Pseudosulfitobacter pseudonitzschiae]
MTLRGISSACAPHGLMVMGASGGRVLVGCDVGFWDVFTASAEYSDGAPDPVDRWSKRIIESIASPLGAATAYPSDGPPYAPFIAWAMDTGRFFQSPVGMMVHDVAGLMISIRGALIFDHIPDFPPTPATSPCDSCTTKPCITACPVGALSAQPPYDVPACKGYLNTTAGQNCMTKGCKVRRACPVSQRFDRPYAQSHFHMKAFHPT